MLQTFFFGEVELSWNIVFASKMSIIINMMESMKQMCCFILIREVTKRGDRMNRLFYLHVGNFLITDKKYEKVFPILNNHMQGDNRPKVISQSKVYV